MGVWGRHSSPSETLNVLYLKEFIYKTEENFGNLFLCNRKNPSKVKVWIYLLFFSQEEKINPGKKMGVDNENTAHRWIKSIYDLKYMNVGENQLYLICFLRHQYSVLCLFRKDVLSGQNKKSDSANFILMGRGHSQAQKSILQLKLILLPFFWIGFMVSFTKATQLKRIKQAKNKLIK